MLCIGCCVCVVCQVYQWMDAQLAQEDHERLSLLEDREPEAEINDTPYAKLVHAQKELLSDLHRVADSVQVALGE